MFRNFADHAYRSALPRFSPGVSGCCRTRIEAEKSDAGLSSCPQFHIWAGVFRFFQGKNFVRNNSRTFHAAGERPGKPRRIFQIRNIADSSAAIETPVRKGLPESGAMRNSGSFASKSPISIRRLSWNGKASLIFLISQPTSSENQNILFAVQAIEKSRQSLKASRISPFSKNFLMKSGLRSLFLICISEL